MFFKRNGYYRIIVDETQLKLVLNISGYGVAIENDNQEIIEISISKERNMFVARTFSIKYRKKSMKNIQFQLMEVPGIHRLARF